MNMRNALSITMLICLLCGILLVASIFIPYVSADKNVRSELKQSDEVIDEDMNLKLRDMADVSLLLLARISNRSYSQGGVLYIIMLVIYALFSVLVLLFAALKKPVPMLIFDVLMFIVFLIQDIDYKSFSWGTWLYRINYTHSVAYYLIIVAAAIVFVGSIFMIVFKKKLKKQGITDVASDYVPTGSDAANNQYYRKEL